MKFFSATKNDGLLSWWKDESIGQVAWNCLFSIATSKLKTYLLEHKDITFASFIEKAGRYRKVMAYLTSTTEHERFGKQRSVNNLYSPISHTAGYCMRNMADAVARFDRFFSETDAVNKSFSEFSEYNQQRLLRRCEYYKRSNMLTDVSFENATISLYTQHTPLNTPTNTFLRVRFTEPIAWNYKNECQYDVHELRMIRHCEIRQIKEVITEAELIFEALINGVGKLSIDEAIDKIARLTYYVAQATPFKRGSAAVGQLIYRAFFELYKINTFGPEASDQLPLDLKAILTSSIDDFVRNFTESFVKDTSESNYDFDYFMVGDLYFRAIAHQSKIEAILEESSDNILDEILKTRTYLRENLHTILDENNTDLQSKRQSLENIKQAIVKMGGDLEELLSSVEKTRLFSVETPKSPGV